MVMLVASIMGLDPHSYEYANYEEHRPGHDPNYGLDPGQLSLWGWTPPVTFEEGVKATVEWSVSNSIWLEQ
jgi:dTDP-glucose 4,6-dehydratase